MEGRWMQPEKPDCEVGLRYGTVKYGKACNVRYGGNGVGKSEKSSQVEKEKPRWQLTMYGSLTKILCLALRRWVRVH